MKKEIYHAAEDSQFQKPAIDVEERRIHIMPDDSRLEYCYIHGCFEGTDVKFSFHIPKKEMFGGRFFQHLSPFPGPDEEMASLEKSGEEDVIGFALSHGACFVESNMGSKAVFTSNPDATIYYRSSATVAEFCRKTLQRLYGPRRIYGYVFGGSGGGYKTMSCIENTDAWDGAIAYVIGSPVSLPSCLTVGAHGIRMLRRAYPKIVDALEPGGSGNVYEGLDREEQEALKELIQIGFPPRMCYTFASGEDGSLPVLAPSVHQMDPDYFTDFWTKPGYLGTEENSSAVRDRIQIRTKVLSVGFLSEDGKEIPADAGCRKDTLNGVDNAWKKMLSDGNNAYLELEQVPEGDYLYGLNMEMSDGKAKGKKMLLSRLEGRKAVLGMCYGSDNLAEVLGLIQPGDAIFLDNSDYIAIQTYHRHQVPEDTSFTAWDQYRDAEGNPIYPQRKEILSFQLAGSSGSLQDGRIQGKVMVMNNLMDGDFPWQADWYRKKIERECGEKFAEENFRIYYNDNCPHGDEDRTSAGLRTVSYLGMLHQALLDLSSWVEDGKLPPENTGYRVEENQVILAPDIQERYGYQPDIQLLANGRESISVKPGEEVFFEAVVKMPENGGICEQVEWSFEGEADYPVKSRAERFEAAGAINSCRISESHVFQNPGTYFVVARVTANRNPQDMFTRLRNLARVRVVVKS